MKVNYVANIRIPTEKAHGGQIIKMCSVLSDLGVEVELIIPTRMNKEFENVDPFKYYGLQKSFAITKLKSYDPRFLLRFPGGMYAKIQSFLFLLKVKIYLRKNDNESIIYTRDVLALPFLTKYSKNVVWECHSLPSKRNFYLPFWKKCKHIFTITSLMKKEMHSIGIEENKLSSLPDAVDIEIFDAVTQTKNELRKELGLPQDKKIIGYVGKFLTMGKDKGINDLLAAKRNLSKDIIICCVGGSEHEIRMYEEKAKEIGLAEKDYLLVPQVKPSFVPRYCKAFDVLAMPFPNIPHYARFMSPLKMFEYMASRRPIIASDLPSVRDVLNEENCFFCIPDNYKAVSRVIEEVMESDSEVSKRTRKAYEDVQHFTWKKRAIKIMKTLE